MTNREKILKFINLAMIIGFTFVLVSYIGIQYNENKALKEGILYDEMVLLNTVRKYEYEKRIERLYLLKCNGVADGRLDSLRFMIESTNEFYRIRDSVYISIKYQNLKK